MYITVNTVKIAFDIILSILMVFIVEGREPEYSNLFYFVKQIRLAYYFLKYAALNVPATPARRCEI